jgi:hypothetical protein
MTAKWLASASALALGLGLAAAFVAPPASADVFVTATITKDKDITITETITITKTVTIDAVVDIDVEKAAESDALVNQTNNGNEACTNCDEKIDVILGSGNNNAGVLSVNNASGNNNNQGNVVAVALDLRVGLPPGEEPPPPAPSTVGGFAEAQAAAEQFNDFNSVDSINLLFRTAQISGSFNDNHGIIHANNSAGNMANQANAFSVAVSLITTGAEDAVALSEADLGQSNTFNRVLESDAGGTPFVGINKLAQIDGSVIGNTGVVGINNTAGNMANQGNVVALAAVVPGT